MANESKAKHHIFQTGAPLCGSKDPGAKAATGGSTVGTLCHACVKIAGTRSLKMVHDRDAMTLEDAALSLPREVLAAGLVAIHEALYRPGASEVERYQGAQKALMQIVAEQEG